MKTARILLAIILISAISCEKEIIMETFSLGIESDFKYNREYHSAGNQLNFLVTGINDSRCPADVICVWEGKVDVKIEVKSPIRGTIELSSYQHSKDTLENYAFELIDVLPYPVSTVSIKLEDYNVTLKVVELKK